MACGILLFLDQDWTQAMAVKAPGPNYWAAREFPYQVVFRT